MFRDLFPERRFYIVYRADGQVGLADSRQGQGLVVFPSEVMADLWIDFVARAAGGVWKVKALSPARFVLLLAAVTVHRGLRFFFHARLERGRWYKRRMEAGSLLQFVSRVCPADPLDDQHLASLLFRPESSCQP